MRNLIIATAVMVLALPLSLRAQDCIFQIADDDSLETALTTFHDVMSELLHGPVEEGDLAPLRERMGEMIAARDAVMAANLPAKYSESCIEISNAARTFSDATDALVELIELQTEDEAVKQAFMRVHDAYRDLRQAMILPEEMIEALHEVIQPLWHEAYPAKDTESIKAGTPKLKVRAKLLLSIAERIDNAVLAEATKGFLDSIATLEEAIAAEDDAATLQAFEIVHEAFHKISGE
jgi:hypothetical protein